MAEIVADGGPIPHIPDDVTIPQFILDLHHPARPILKTPQPWLIDELSGREVCSDEVRAQCGLASDGRQRAEQTATATRLREYAVLI